MRFIDLRSCATSLVGDNRSKRLNPWGGAGLAFRHRCDPGTLAFKCLPMLPHVLNRVAQHSNLVLGYGPELGSPAPLTGVEEWAPRTMWSRMAARTRNSIKSAQIFAFNFLMFAEL